MAEGEFVRVVQKSELPHGAKHAVDIGGQSVLICNWKDQLFAVSNICSHAHEKLCEGRLGNGWIACPVHGARFQLASGNAMNPPATKPIAVFELRVVDDWIEVKI